jgi:hypothetical protein
LNVTQLWPNEEGLARFDIIFDPMRFLKNLTSLFFSVSTVQKGGPIYLARSFFPFQSKDEAQPEFIPIN